MSILSFVGGKPNGRTIAAGLDEKNKRYMLEMEGVNAYGMWNFSNWSALGAQLKKGFDYGKQRCTASVRYVIQRELFSRFLEMYLPLLKSLKFGNPTLVNGSEDPLPVLDFGPLINRQKVEELIVLYRDALEKSAVSLYEGYNEPFGPVDTTVLVDTIEDLVAEMNVSNGCLVASIACDEPATAKSIAVQLRAFKVGIDAMRSGGDRDECFGGLGESWKGYFAGGGSPLSAAAGPIKRKSQ